MMLPRPLFFAALVAMFTTASVTTTQASVVNENLSSQGTNEVRDASRPVTVFTERFGRGDKGASEVFLSARVPGNSHNLEARRAAARVHKRHNKNKTCKSKNAGNAKYTHNSSGSHKSHSNNRDHGHSSNHNSGSSSSNNDSSSNNSDSSSSNSDSSNSNSDSSSSNSDSSNSNSNSNSNSGSSNSGSSSGSGKESSSTSSSSSKGSGSSSSSSSSPSSSSSSSDESDSSNSSSSSSSSTGNGSVSDTKGSGSYQRVQQNRGSGFWSGNWDFFTHADPTQGQVDFQSESGAKSKDLIGMKNGTAFMRTSNEDIGAGQNRPSVRFQSKKAYDSGLVIFDVAKMPVGCATWPALWTTMGSTWPRNGEIDVVEGTGYTSGSSNANQMTVHLGSNSPLNLRRRAQNKRAAHSYSGKLVSGASNCNQYGQHTGCAFFDSNDNGPSWGTDFNEAGGGIWAMQFGKGNGVKIWFWGRESGKIPSELKDPSSSPKKLDPSSWDTPVANFQTSLINSEIKQQNIIMDITIGGQWAGNVPMDGKCKGQSLSSAIQKGSNYNDAEFLINAIDIYCENGSC